MTSEDIFRSRVKNLIFRMKYGNTFDVNVELFRHIYSFESDLYKSFTRYINAKTREPKNQTYAIHFTVITQGKNKQSYTFYDEKTCVTEQTRHEDLKYGFGRVDIHPNKISKAFFDYFIETGLGTVWPELPIINGNSRVSMSASDFFEFIIDE